MKKDKKTQVIRDILARLEDFDIAENEDWFEWVQYDNELLWKAVNIIKSQYKTK